MAVAAKYALNTVKRVLVFDWDIHQADGTQQIFYDSAQVLLMSLHRSDNCTYYPYRQDATGEHIGHQGGLGFTCNVAWNTGEVVDEKER